MIIKGFCQLFHPLLIYIMKSQREQRNQKLHILNDHPTYTGKNAIYVVNHSCKHDFPISGEVIGNHTCVLAGKQKLYLSDYIAFLLNGVIWVDRESRESKKVAFQKMLSCMRKGLNMCVFPEATWNLTPSKPMLPMYWGVVDLAKQSGCPIIPLILEFRDNDCYAWFGEPIYCLPDDMKKDKFTKLEETMATIKWKIWELFPVEKRDTINLNEWNLKVKQRLLEYPILNYEYEKQFIRGMSK
ncbi:MAG: 1-acyl-sn-glycerol-3-phosphate acyltransferase [Lachnospiraceae bacterium]|nr:1-acyl-sn-glycerol-3-phosphate acyltransferase [Lachnospiraceae bacterium]